MAPFLAYEDKGADTPPALPLVLVHGHPFDRTMWALQIEAFSPTRRVIAPDLRGYGASPVVPGITLLSDFTQDIAALLDELKVETFVLAGLSMGGQIAMDICWQFPDRVRGLVLADTFPAPETPAADWRATRWPTGCSRRACGATPTRSWRRWSPPTRPPR